MGCKNFAVYVMENQQKDNQLKIEDIPSSKYFKDTSLEEFPVVPPKRDIDFMIDLALWEVRGSKYPYRMNIVQITKPKSQLQELIDKKSFDLVFPLEKHSSYL